MAKFTCRLRSRILKIGESAVEELETSIILTAGEINMNLVNHGEMIIDILPKAMGTLAHKSFLYGALATKIEPLLAKTVIEDVIKEIMPAAFARGDKMACTACIRFLGCCWINGVLKEDIFEKIVRRLSEKPNRLISMVCLTTLPLLLRIKENTVVEYAMRELAEYLDTLNDNVPE